MKNIFYNLTDRRLGPLSDDSLRLIKTLEEYSDYLTYSNGSIFFHKNNLKYKISHPNFFEQFKTNENFIVNCELFFYITEEFNIEIFENVNKFKRCFVVSENIKTIEQYEENISLNKLDNKIYCVYLGDKNSIRSINSFSEISRFLNSSQKIHFYFNKILLSENFYDLTRVLSNLKLNKIRDFEYANYKIEKV